MQPIKKLNNKVTVTFDKGKFDDWCVYLVERNGYQHAPTDYEYFSAFLKLSDFYSSEKLYNDFLKIYNRTTQNIDFDTLLAIDKITKSYQLQHQNMIQQWFTVIYAAMVAEENKAYTILKKRIKRLGMYQLLVLRWSIEEATTFSKGKKWKELASIMTGFGF